MGITRLAHSFRSRFRPGLLWALLGLSLLAACQIQGESPAGGPIQTDRPGFLFSPSPVAVGRFQVEAGLPSVVSSELGEGRSTSLGFPVALRYGLSEVWELRAGLPAWTQETEQPVTGLGQREGFGDGEVGAKVALGSLLGGPVAAQFGLRLPSGSRDFSGDGLGGSAYLLHGRPVGESYALSALAGLTLTPVASSAEQSAAAVACLVSRSFGSRSSAYVSLTALPGVTNVPGQAYLGSAFLWLLTDAIQVDISLDVGLDPDSTDLLGGLGVAWYF